MKKKNVIIISASFLIVALLAIITFAICIKLADIKKQHTITVLSGHLNTKEYFLSAMKKAHPEYNYEYTELDWGEDFSYKMQEMIQTKKVPDIIIGKAQDMYIYQRDGIIAPFDESLMKNYTVPSDLYSIDNQIYCLPYDVIYQGVIYNKDIFDVYSLEIPKTKKELEAIVDKLNNLGITPFAANYGDSWQIANNLMQFELNNVFKTEPHWGSDFNNNLTSFSDSIMMYNCLNDIKYIADNSWSDCLEIDSEKAYQKFYNGGAAMYLSGTWSIEDAYEYKSDINIGIFPYPNESGNSDLIFESDTAFMKSSSTIHEDVVDDIIENIISDKELAGELAEVTGNLSLLYDVNTVKYSRTLLSDIARYEKNADIIDASVGNSQLIWNFQLAQAVETTKFLKGEVTAEDTLANNDRNQFINKGTEK